MIQKKKTWLCVGAVGLWTARRVKVPDNLPHVSSEQRLTCRHTQIALSLVAWIICETLPVHCTHFLTILCSHEERNQETMPSPAKNSMAWKLANQQVWSRSWTPREFLIGWSFWCYVAPSTKVRTQTKTDIHSLKNILLYGLASFPGLPIICSSICTIHKSKRVAKKKEKTWENLACGWRQVDMIKVDVGGGRGPH